MRLASRLASAALIAAFVLCRPAAPVGEARFAQLPPLGGAGHVNAWTRCHVRVSHSLIVGQSSTTAASMPSGLRCTS